MKRACSARRLVTFVAVIEELHMFGPLQEEVSA